MTETVTETTYGCERDRDRNFKKSDRQRIKRTGRQRIGRNFTTDWLELHGFRIAL